jgi:hypothetical protein
MSPRLDLVFEATCCWLALLVGVFVVVNRVFDLVDVSVAPNIVTFLLLTLLAAWIWTRPSPPPR